MDSSINTVKHWERFLIVICKRKCLDASKFDDLSCFADHFMRISANQKLRARFWLCLWPSTTVHSAKGMLKARQHQYISVKAEKDCKKELKIRGSLSVLLPSDISTDYIVMAISPTGRKRNLKWSQHNHLSNRFLLFMNFQVQWLPALLFWLIIAEE